MKIKIFSIEKKETILDLEEKFNEWEASERHYIAKIFPITDKDRITNLVVCYDRLKKMSGNPYMKGGDSEWER